MVHDDFYASKKRRRTIAMENEENGVKDRDTTKMGAIFWIS